MTAARAIPPIHGVVESILYVDDLPRAVAFYSDVLGFAAVTGDGERFQALDAGGKGVLLLFKRGATLAATAVPGGVTPPHDGRGPHHIAFGIDPESFEHGERGCARGASRSKAKPTGSAAGGVFIFAIRTGISWNW